MGQPKKLIEVAMPVKEISAESVRDKSIRHGHISTLHLWWARRPLPVCRAIIFASLVPDPLDENCPQQFKDSIEILLGSNDKPLHQLDNYFDPYKPYDDIPYTAAVDKMDDNFRNRLLVFIGKFSNEFSSNQKSGKITASNKTLSDHSLIKWENKNNEAIINKARKLIWVSFNLANDPSKKNCSAHELLIDFENHYNDIKEAENELYAIQDRHIESPIVSALNEKLHNAIEAFLNKMPKVFDPFAGGGAIPLEAARLGCRSFGNDINPVAHIIQKGGLEFPQKFGKPMTIGKSEFVRMYGLDEWNKIKNEDIVFKNGDAVAVIIKNRLSHDVGFYAKKLLLKTENEIGNLYPADINGKKPIAYYWARIGKCSNPSCKAEVPLLRQFYLCNKEGKKVYLKPEINNNKINFSIASGISKDPNWVLKGNLSCPCCGSLTDGKTLRNEVEKGNREVRLLAVIDESKEGKVYRLPRKDELELIIPETEVPTELLPSALTGGSIMSWGYKTWGEMFTKRQLNIFNTLNKHLVTIKEELSADRSDYGKAIICFLSLMINRTAMMSTSFGLWKEGLEAIVSPFSKQAIPMVFDYPEPQIFSNSTGSALNQLEWITRYIESECNQPFYTILKNASSGEKEQFPEKYITSVITDPPYYDAIAYADLSDFFYVWLKKNLGDLYPLNFATPQTPKTEECTALKHHHNGKVSEAKHHFESKLLNIFDAIEHQTSDIVSIMFAHQSTEAWTTLCNSILGARMNITGSWAIDSERQARTLALSSSALESSVTVACKPAQRIGLGEYKLVKIAIEKTVAKEVEELYSLGFRGADLLTACFGQAVSEFGKYEKVEKADGSEVTVAELLEMARESAFNALLKGFDGDEFTKFYVGWLQLYGFSETNFDDAAKFSRIGLSINVNELFSSNILIKKGTKQSLGGYNERVSGNSKLGENSKSLLIDKVHRGMFLYNATANRNLLLQFINDIAPNHNDNFWRVITSLCEILPAGTLDYDQSIGLQTNKESLIRESKMATMGNQEQTILEL